MTLVKKAKKKLKPVKRGEVVPKLKVLRKKIVTPIPEEPKVPTWEERVEEAWKVVRTKFPDWKVPDLVECTKHLPFMSTEGAYIPGNGSPARRAYPSPQQNHCGIGYIFSWKSQMGGVNIPACYGEFNKALFIVWCDYMRTICPYGLIYTTTAEYQTHAIALLKEVGWVPSPGGSNHTHDYREALIWTWVNHPVKRDPRYKPS